MNAAAGSLGAEASDGVLASTSRSKGEPDERLLELFRNRAELKKAFAGMRQERERLLEQLRDQQQLTVREQQRLKALESRLSDPETGYQVIVHYQLRGLWETCTEQLLRFSKELQRQQQDRERKKQIMEFNVEREQRLRALDGQVKTIKKQAEAVKASVVAAEAELESLQGIWNYFKRRRAEEKLNLRRAELEQVREGLEEQFDKRIKIESEPWPEHHGLGVDSKRIINVAVLALTQYLYLHFTESSLSRMAREATLKSAGAVNYGSRSDCDALIGLIGDVVVSLRSKRGYAEELKARAGFLRGRAKYKEESDTIPIPESIETIPLTVEDGDTGIPIDVNVLTDNYWNVLSVLMR